MMNTLQCDSKTLFAILESLVQETNFPDLDQEAKLSLLEALEADPERSSQIKQALQHETEGNDLDLEGLSAPTEFPW
jgi:hypothetical protein